MGGIPMYLVIEMIFALKSMSWELEIKGVEERNMFTFSKYSRFSMLNICLSQHFYLSHNIHFLQVGTGREKNKMHDI